MLLATYQPLSTNVGVNQHAKNYSNLENYLGFSPIFCISANTLEDLIIQSILAAPNCPERLIVFETEKFFKLDIIKWNQFLFYNKLNEEHFPVSDCFKPSNDSYCEYIVNSIENVLYEVNLKDCIYKTQFVISSDNDDYGKFAESLFEGMQKNAQQAIEHLLVTGSISKEMKELMEKRKIKSAYELYLAPLVHAGNINYNLFDLPFVNGNKYYEKGVIISNLLTDIYNAKKKPTYDKFDLLLHEIKSCIEYPFKRHGSSEKVGRNSPCPCGSGKKYKHCCGR